MKKDIDYTKISSRASDYLDTRGKLTELGVMLVVDALLIKREDLLPVEVLEHLQKNPDNQEDVYEYYHAMRQLNTGYLQNHPYFNPTTRQRLKHRKQQRVKSAVLVLTMLVGVYLLIYLVKRIDSFQFKPNAQAELAPIEPIQTPTDICVDYIPYDQDKEKLIVPFNQARKFVLENGSEIIIPEEAFVNQSGEKIHQDVEIKYREFHKAAEIIASGIPMDYDSAGVKYHFESAGMFEIKAYQKNGQEAFLADAKSIQVNLATDGDEKGFNHYFLEEQTDLKPKWKLLGQSILSSDHSFASEEDAAQIYEESLLNENSQKENSFNISVSEEDQAIALEPPAYPVFQLNFNLDKSPELEEFSKQYWQWIDMGDLTENPYVNTWVLDTPWEEFRLDTMSKERYQPMAIQLPDQFSRIYFNKEETQALFSCKDGKARLINLQSGKTTYFDRAWTARFTPDEKYIYTTLDDVKLWSLDGQLIHNFGTPEYGVKSVKFSPDSQFLLITSKENHIRLYDIQGNFIARVWAGTENYSYALSTFEVNNLPSKGAFFTPDSRFIVVQSLQGNHFQSWNIRGQAIQLNQDHPIETVQKPLSAILNDSKLLDLYIQQPDQLMGIYSHLERANNASRQKIQDFTITNLEGILYADDTELLNLLTDQRNQNMFEGFFSPKGTYLISHEKSQELSPVNVSKFTLYKRNPKLQKQEEQYILYLKRLAGGRKSKFRMIVKKVSAQDIKAEKELTKAIKNYKKQIKEAKISAQKQAENTNKLYRVFEVKKLGIYNVDRIYKMQDQIAVQADFQWDKAQNKIPITVYLVCGKNQSVVIPFHPKNWDKFSFNPNDRNQLIAILPDSKIAYFKPKDFTKINLNKINKQDKFTFKLHTKTTTGSLDELKAILN